jgi:ammonia channel protein AmtB
VIDLTAINIVIILVFFIGVAFYEIPGLLKKKYTREIWVFSILMVVALALAIYFALGYKISLPI